MLSRDWFENMILKAVLEVNPELEDISKNSEIISEAIQKSLPEIVEILDKSLLKTYKKGLRTRQIQTRNFRKRLQKRWQSPFRLLEFFIYFNREFGENVCDSIRNKKIENIKFETLFRLHARAIQIALEILELLKGGFADGAIARWRSLYEISIIATFLSDKDEQVSQRYLDYYFIENYKEMLEYQENCTRLNYEAFSEEETAEIEYLYQEQIKKYGNGFGKHYGWIGDLLPKDKWSFKGIEETIEFGSFRPFYKMANNYVHSGSKGFLFKLGLYNTDNIMLAGPSDYGFADPGQNTAFSLMHTTLTLVEFETYLENSAYVELFRKFINRISDEFVKVQKQMESEEEE